MEKWENINLCPWYQVSSYWRVKSLWNNKKRKEKILKQKLNKWYPCINFSIKWKQKWFSVHRLVALNFIPNTDPLKLTINHKDWNKLNNHIDNLEWMTVRDNNLHAKLVLWYTSVRYKLTSYRYMYKDKFLKIL